MHAESLHDLVRMAEKEPHMKALITTAYGDVDKLTVGVRLGMDPYKRLAEFTEGLTRGVLQPSLGHLQDY